MALYLIWVSVILGVLVLVLLVRTKELRTYWPMVVMANWPATPGIVLMYVRHLGSKRISATHAYQLYFYTFWPSYVIGLLCSALLTYTIFRAAMRPLKGLQSLGNIMYGWAAGISLATAVSVAISPVGGEFNRFNLVAGQLQRSTAILIVSLVLFVALSIRPMGLSWKSRVFGASLGTMILSCTQVVESNSVLRGAQMFSRGAVADLASGCVALCIWVYYFAIPEPKRKFILLPTNSPFHYWNKVSQMLGEQPGVVAIGGIAPEVIATAELEIFRRASVKMKEVEERETDTALGAATVALNKVQLTKH